MKYVLVLGNYRDYHYFKLKHLDDDFEFVSMRPENYESVISIESDGIILLDSFRAFPLETQNLLLAWAMNRLRLRGK
jgi:hypothetical protein